MNLAVFVSTNGTDLQVIIDALKNNSLKDVDLKFVLSNKEDCFGLQRAKEAGFKTIYINGKDKTREEYDLECLNVCQEHNIDLIVLIGYMRIMSKVIVDPYKERIMNIHPSLLPKYPGMDLDVHAEGLSNNEKKSGCTLHWVTLNLDDGPIILQEEVLIEPNETIETLKEKVQLKEQEVILKGIELFRDGKL